MMKDLLLKNRSYRSYDPEIKPSVEQLAELVDATRLCPSSRNLQLLKFRLVYKKEEVSSVLPLTRWAGILKGVQIPPAGHEPPAFIVICADTSITPNAATYGKDVGIAAQSILLCAVEMDMGGCMIGSFDPTRLQQVLSIPEELVPVLVVAIGKPDEEICLTHTREGSTDYYRENGVHYVPKRSLEDLLI